MTFNERTMLHVSELPAFEHAYAGTSLRSPEVEVLGWEERDGFACLPDVLVRGGYGVKRVPIRRAAAFSCQRCKQQTVLCPLTLHVRYEHALGRLLFWFGIPSDATYERSCSCTVWP